jgi:arginine decarboxylase
VKIFVTTGRGVGATKLSAFDAALWDAGIAGYNLIYLSSVIPTNCEVVEERFCPKIEELGWKLYCVISIGHRSLDEGSDIWAGVGWAVGKRCGGIFIEEVSTSRDGVIGKIENAYAEMSERRGDIGTLKTALIQAPPPTPFSCCVAAAVYKAEPWTE